MAETIPPCFFCAHDLEAHRKNALGHPWRRGDRVTRDDLNLADAVTIQRYWRPSPETVTGEQ